MTDRCCRMSTDEQILRPLLYIYQYQMLKLCEKNARMKGNIHQNGNTLNHNAHKFLTLPKFRFATNCIKIGITKNRDPLPDEQ